MGATCGIPNLLEVNAPVVRELHTASSRYVCRPLVKVSNSHPHMHADALTCNHESCSHYASKSYTITQPKEKLPPSESAAYHHSGTEINKSPYRDISDKVNTYPLCKPDGNTSARTTNNRKLCTPPFFCSVDH